MFCMFCLVCLLRLPSLSTLTNSPSPFMLHMLRLLRLLCLLRLLDPQQRAKSEEKEGDEQKHVRMHGARAATFASDAVTVASLAGSLPLARNLLFSRGVSEVACLSRTTNSSGHSLTRRTCTSSLV